MALLRSCIGSRRGFFIFPGFYMDVKKCTLKERKQAARILSAREGAEKQITKTAAEIVGSMSDVEIIKFLDENAKTAADAVEILTPENVEEIKPGAASEDLYSLCKNLVDSYITANGWDAEKITPLQWGACCLAVGRFFRSRSLLRGVPEDPNTNKGIKEINATNGLNTEALTAAAGAWLELCFKYNKTPLICDFCEFVAINKQSFYNLGESVTPGRIDLYKRIKEIEADGLRRRVLDPKSPPIGAMFLLKADHGLVEATKVQHEYIKTEKTAAALPVWDDSGRLLPKND